MPGIKLTDVTKAASLLKKVVDRADVMKDGALSREEIRYLRDTAKGVTKDPATLAALNGAHGFGRATGPQPLSAWRRRDANSANAWLSTNPLPESVARSLQADGE
jgi:hypothetical protein